MSKRIGDRAMAGYILWEGNSLYDESPIVLIMTMESGNDKTGNMVQTWILCQDIDPITASRTGQDRAICGNCPHMGKPSGKATGWAANRSCYVNLLHGPNNIWKAYRKGLYPKISLQDMERLVSGRIVRFGSYGDPAAVPPYIWQCLSNAAKGHTAYTHGAINPLPEILMTSADNQAQAQEAWQRGERTFRVVSSLDELLNGLEVLCPASKEAGKRTTCDRCKLCSGSALKAKSIAIVAHGNGKKHFAA